MTFESNYERSITRHARRIVLERICYLRKVWEVMANDKDRGEVKEQGVRKLDLFQTLMVDSTAIDLLDVSVSAITSYPIALVDEQKRMLDVLTRNLFIELKADQVELLISEISRAMVQWSWSCGSIVPDDPEQSLEIDLEPIRKQYEDTLYGNLGYVTLILMSDLYHIAFIQSAEKCFETL